jgi:hypothetical protein
MSPGKPILVIKILLLLCWSRSLQAQSIRYVDDDATVGGDGLAWTTAYRHLQDALWEAGTNGAINQIRVAQGSYAPDQDEGGHVTPGDRAATFQQASGLGTYGGYVGLAGPGDPNERDPFVYETILTGDLAGDDGADLINNGENSYHVVTAGSVDASALLDGCSVTAGNANGGAADANGGGIYCSGGNPTIQHCIIRSNKAAQLGGGMYSQDAAPNLTDCTVAVNRAFYGAAVYNLRANATYERCRIATNLPGDGGAGMYNHTSDPTLTNCIIGPNDIYFEDGSGGGIYNYASNPLLINCLLALNRAGGRYGYGGGIFNREDSNPTLVNCAVIANVGRGFEPLAGQGMHTFTGIPTVTNCIFWANGYTPTEGEQIGGTQPVVNHTCVQGWSGTWGGTGNIGDDPNLPPVYTGNWTQPSAYSITQDRAVYTDETANWVEDSLVGNMLRSRSNIGDPLLIVANTATTITALAREFEGTIVASGIAYEMYDYRIAAGSPCIDAANNAAVTVPTDLDGRPRIIDGDGDGTTTVDMGPFELGTTPIPTTSQYGLIVMAVLTLAAGALLLRSRRPKLTES